MVKSWLPHKSCVDSYHEFLSLWPMFPKVPSWIMTILSDCISFFQSWSSKPKSTVNIAIITTGWSTIQATPNAVCL